MSQTSRLYELLRDGQAHRTDEIVEKIYGPGLSLARVGARIYDVSEKYDVKIDGWHDVSNRKLYWYKIVGRKIAVQKTVERINQIPAMKTPLKVETSQATLL